MVAFTRAAAAQAQYLKGNVLIDNARALATHAGLPVAELDLEQSVVAIGMAANAWTRGKVNTAAKIAIQA
jgi:hypothetical protein